MAGTPKRKTVTDLEARLAQSRAEIESLTAQSVAVAQRLDAALLQDDAAAVETIEAELAVLRTKRDRHARQVALLENERAELEREATARAMGKHVGRIVSEIEAWAANAGEIEKVIGKLAALISRQVELGGRIHSAWPWNEHERAVMALTAERLRILLSAEFYRSGALTDPTRTLLPGSVCPDMNLRLRPEAIKSFSDNATDIASFAIEALRNRASGPAAPSINPAAIQKELCA